MTSLATQLIELGLSVAEAEKIATLVDDGLKKAKPEQCWQDVAKELQQLEYSFPIHKFLYETIYPEWDKSPAPVWFPRQEDIKKTNIAKLMQERGFSSYDELHHWSVTNKTDFWNTMIGKLNIIFDKTYKSIVNLSDGIESPHWFPDSQLNIINSCWRQQPNHDDHIAIITQNEQGKIKKISYAELDKLSNRVANSISKHFQVGERIAIIMPMTIESIAIYLGIIKAGCCVVSIPDSFSANEIAKRLRIAKTKVVFTQDIILHAGEHLNLYEKIIDANVGLAIVFSAKNNYKKIRNQDISWVNFLSDDDTFSAVSLDPGAYTTILFSSGTMGEPKAIPWNQTTPIKCASDAYLHHDIQTNDVICWPTSLGWMMGSWLIYAVLINHATIAIYEGSANSRNFGKFVQDVKVTLLGIVPTLVKTWRDSGCMEGLDWRSIKLFSSSGECSNIDDMFYLMSLTNYRPIIEYCGGTEIGGAYITGTLIQPSAPSAFTARALGLDFKIIDEDGSLIDNGEVALIPPSIGLSTELLNKNHHQIYYANMPKLPSGEILRRHGDQIKQFANGFYRLFGRIDDTMNLSGIKVSSAEIETILNMLPSINETAAIAINPTEGGPSKLIIYAVLKPTIKINIPLLKKDMQQAIKNNLNPLFKIHEVIIADYLPKTSSNKIMRRILREEYEEEKSKNHAKIIKESRSKKKICLALQGGGAYGAYTWGILDKFLEDERLEIDAISATSAGSVNAVVLTIGMINGGNQGARNALNDFWQTLCQYGSYLSPIRQASPFLGPHLDLDIASQASFILFDLITRTFSPYMLNPFNFDLLKIILCEKIDFKKIRINNQIKLYLSATNVKSGMLHVFENPEISVDAVLASACLPNLSQAVRINGEYYWDGGYLGNPAIFPLIYNSNVDDIIIIHNNPIIRDSIPMTSTDIDSRVNELSFNSSLMRELRAIAFVTKLIDKGWIKDEYRDKLRRKYLHMIRSDEVMNQFYLINKYNWHWGFISHLRDLGRNTAEIWLKNNFHHLGKKQTIDFNEFLGADTQTST